MSSFSNPHYFYLFAMKNGKKKLAYGNSPEDAFENLRLRLSDQEMQRIDQTQFEKILQSNLQEHVRELG